MSARTIYPISLSIIHEEHLHLAAVIQGMQYFVRAIDDGAIAPDLKVFRAMLFYISEYPERVHHPKEEKFLFAKIRDRTHQLDQDLDKLSEQHAQGEFLLHRLQHALLRYEFFGATEFIAFRDKALQYCQFYYEHMRTEETLIMPVARQVLNDQDWREVDTAFLENRAELDQEGERYRYEQLFSLIVNIAPPPIGVGEELNSDNAEPT